MTLTQKLADLVALLQQVVTLTGQVTTALTDLNTFLDTNL